LIKILHLPYLPCLHVYKILPKKVKTRTCGGPKFSNLGSRNFGAFGLHILSPENKIVYRRETSLRPPVAALFLFDTIIWWALVWWGGRVGPWKHGRTHNSCIGRHAQHDFLWGNIGTVFAPLFWSQISCYFVIATWYELLSCRRTSWIIVLYIYAAMLSAP
jgi:hypothetical protein